MHIVHVLLTRDFGGTERYVVDLAHLQLAQGHQVTVILSTQQPAGGVASLLPQQAAQIFLPRVNNVIDRLWQPLWLRWRMANLKPTVVHAHLKRAARVVGNARLKAPTVASLHLNYREKDYKNLSGLIAINSSQLADAQQKHYQGQLAHIPNWLPALPTPTPQQVAAQRAAWRLGEGDVAIGSLSRLHPQKGVDVLVEAFAQANLTPHTHLIIVGSGPQQGALQSQIAALPAAIQSRIHMVGATQTPAVCYAAFDGFVMASRHEPFGLTLIEAMHAGCPVVATACAGPVDIFAAAGLPQNTLVPPQNPAALAAALTRTFSRKPLRQKYRLTAFAPTAAAQKITEFYAHCLATPPANG